MELDDNVIDLDANKPSSEELAKRGDSAVGAAFREAVQGEGEKVRKEILGEITEISKTRGDRAPTTVQDEKPGETLSRMRVTDPSAPLYSRLPEEEREWRTPEGDHWMREWIVGQLQGNRAAMLQASEKADITFGFNATQRAERAAMSEGAAGAGGAISASATGGDLVPRPLEAVLMIARDRVAVMRRLATIFNMTRQQHNIPSLAALTGAMAAESGALSEGGAATANIPLVAKKGYCYTLVTEELLEDQAFNVVNLIATRAGGALGVLEDNQFFVDGDGTGNNISARITGTAYTEDTSTVLAYADVVGMYFTVPKAYRHGAVWMVAADVLQFMSGVVSSGSPFYQGLQERPGAITDDPGAVGTVLNRPVFECPLPAGEILFGDPRALYAVGSRAGISMKQSNDVRFANDEIALKFTQRFDGNVYDATANAGQLAAGIASAIVA